MLLPILVWHIVAVGGCCSAAFQPPPPPPPTTTHRATCRAPTTIKKERGPRFGNANNHGIGLIKLHEHRRGDDGSDAASRNDDEKETETLDENIKVRVVPTTVRVDEGERKEKNDRAVMDRLLTPFRIGEALNSTILLFVVFNILLNVAGYAVIADTGGGHSFRIGTVDERRFHDEIVRDAKHPR